MAGPAQTVRDLDFLVARGLTNELFRRLHHFGSRASIQTHRTYCLGKSEFQAGSKNAIVGDRLAWIRQRLAKQANLEDLVDAAIKANPFDTSHRSAKDTPSAAKLDRRSEPKTPPARVREAALASTSRAIGELCRNAVGCRVCFSDGSVQPAYVDLAQPRWIGSTYPSSDPRVLILMLNPGRGAYNSENDRCLHKLLHKFERGKAELVELFDHQRDDMPNWGARGDRFRRFYLEGLGLKLEEVAFANIAWCATADDSYPDSMLQTCFQRHTGPLIELLQPQLIVLSGAKAQSFRTQIAGCPTVPLLHYAHRGGAERESEALTRVRKEIHRLKRRGAGNRPAH